MPKTVANVDEFMGLLDHPLKGVVVAIRQLILDSNPAISEQIKWNAPSFCINGDDRVTFNLRPQDKVQLIFHHGAKPKDTTGFVFEDHTGILKWQAPDRAIATFTSTHEFGERASDFEALVQRWMKATA